MHFLLVITFIAWTCSLYLLQNLYFVNYSIINEKFSKNSTNLTKSFSWMDLGYSALNYSTQNTDIIPVYDFVKEYM